MLHVKIMTLKFFNSRTFSYCVFEETLVYKVDQVRGTVLGWDCFYFLTKLNKRGVKRARESTQGAATLYLEQQYELTSTPALSSLAAYVSEDGLVGHHWKERPIGHENFICPSTGECQGQKVGMGG